MLVGQNETAVSSSNEWVRNPSSQPSGGAGVISHYVQNHISSARNLRIGESGLESF